ncbi:hypothetical protein C8Q75DRAFT_732294 [Abortiporus biennis]|nr:hypothetical protein C8Q75DRAFT_732294 [Abortiporus biennis]
MAKKSDPFIGGKTKQTCDGQNLRQDNQESNQLLNTLIALAGSQLWAQHRNFVFSVVIRGRYARFMRWDRYGAVFSDDLNYHENSMLFSFFWQKFGSTNPE